VHACRSVSSTLLGIRGDGSSDTILSLRCMQVWAERLVPLWIQSTGYHKVTTPRQVTSEWNLFDAVYCDIVRTHVSYRSFAESSVPACSCFLPPATYDNLLMNMKAGIDVRIGDSTSRNYNTMMLTELGGVLVNEALFKTNISDSNQLSSSGNQQTAPRPPGQNLLLGKRSAMIFHFCFEI
jgi:hypothetical protein